MSKKNRRAFMKVSASAMGGVAIFGVALTGRCVGAGSDRLRRIVTLNLP